MKIIKDENGREYCLKLNYGIIEEIRAKLDIDLLDVAHLDLDALKLARVLCIACGDTLNEKKIEPQDFVNSLEGDTIEAAGAALWEELLRFFPSSRRETIRKMFATAAKVVDKQVETANAKLESGEMEKVFEKILNAPSGDSPESSEFIPPPTRSDSST